MNTSYAELFAAASAGLLTLLAGCSDVARPETSRGESAASGTTSSGAGGGQTGGSGAGAAGGQPGSGGCGRAPETLASGSDHPVGIAAFGSDLVWLTEGMGVGSVVRLPVGGGNPVTLASNTAVQEYVAVDATDVYWSTTTGEVMKVPLSGGSPGVLAQDYAFALALRGASLYWTTTTAIVVQPLDGAPSYVLAGGENQPSSLAVRGDWAYWASPDAGAIRRAPLDGGPAETIVQAGWPFSIAVDDEHLYWVDPSEGTVSVVGLGQGDASVIAADQVDPLEIVTDEAGIYWVNRGSAALTDGSIMKATLASGRVEALAQGEHDPRHLTVLGGCVYWTAYGGGSVRVVAH